MENFDLSKIDFFSIKDLKRGELSNIHSVLLFLYNKKNETGDVIFKYSEIDWMYYHNVLKIINKINELNIINIVKRPTPHEPFVVKLKPNNELNFILNKNKKLNFHSIDLTNLNKDIFRKCMDCSSLGEHFLQPTVRTWLRNISNNVWDKNKFLIITKIITFFKCDNKVKTFTVNKYCSKGQNFSKSVKFLYERVPDNQKEILFSQIQNTLNDLNIKHDKSFMNMINNYLNYLETKK